MVLPAGGSTVRSLLSPLTHLTAPVHHIEHEPLRSLGLLLLQNKLTSSERQQPNGGRTQHVVDNHQSNLSNTLIQTSDEVKETTGVGKHINSCSQLTFRGSEDNLSSGFIDPRLQFKDLDSASSIDLCLLGFKELLFLHPRKAALISSHHQLESHRLVGVSYF